MENANFGKRILYGFASFLLIPIVIAYAAIHFTNNPPSWFWWSLLPLSVLSFLFGYLFPLKFERIFTLGLTSAKVVNPSVPFTSVNAVTKVDMQRKMPITMGWFFAILILTCFILLFTKFGFIVPYIFAPGFLIFMIWAGVKYNKKQ